MTNNFSCNCYCVWKSSLWFYLYWVLFCLFSFVHKRKEWCLQLCQIILTKVTPDLTPLHARFYDALHACWFHYGLFIFELPCLVRGLSCKVSPQRAKIYFFAVSPTHRIFCPLNWSVNYAYTCIPTWFFLIRCNLISILDASLDKRRSIRFLLKGGCCALITSWSEKH